MRNCYFWEQSDEQRQSKELSFNPKIEKHRSPECLTLKDFLQNRLWKTNTQVEA